MTTILHATHKLNPYAKRSTEDSRIKAQHDLRSARRLFSDEPPILDTVAFHCQQAAEKGLKAFLTLHDTPFSEDTPAVTSCWALH